MAMLAVVVELLADKVNEIHDDKNRRNDDQRKGSHCSVLVEYDDVHEVHIEHWTLWKIVAVEVLLVVHCEEWAVLVLLKTMNDGDDEYRAKWLETMVDLVAMVLLYSLLNDHYDSIKNVHNDQYALTMKRFQNWDENDD